jgi:arylsulfatase A-like enzyme
VFDTLSGNHTSVDGYLRKTTPNLLRFAQKANVYHRHYSTGSFTNPGTASLLTGVYPWKHRAIRFQSTVHQDYVNRHIFNLLGDAYYRVAYTHNTVAASLLYQLIDDLENLLPIRELSLLNWQITDKLFKNDYAVAVWRESILRAGGSFITFPSSPEWYAISTMRWDKRMGDLNAAYREQYPRGLPTRHGDVFRMEEAIDWMVQNLNKLPKPFLSYFHFYPPHDPYNPTRDFIGMFDDEMEYVDKPQHHFTGNYSKNSLQLLAKHYDEYIAYTDAAFGRLLDYLISSDLQNETIVVITSDHGEMFERGIWGHNTETLYESIVRVPLLISSPGQSQRVDIHTPTSSVDVLPTLLQESNHAIPNWCDGRILPGFIHDYRDCDIYALDAKGNSVNQPIKRATFALVRGEYKLILYKGYPGYNDAFELYNVKSDPHELNDLYTSKGTIAQDLRIDLLAKIADINSVYT